MIEFISLDTRLFGQVESSHCNDPCQNRSYKYFSFCQNVLEIINFPLYPPTADLSFHHVSTSD